MEYGYTGSRPSIGSKEGYVDEEEKRFKLELQKLEIEKPDVYNTFNTLLFQEKVSLAEKNNGRPVTISLDAKKEILERAIKETGKPPVDATKMESAWNTAAFASKGRPPIGGAQDD